MSVKNWVYGGRIPSPQDVVDDGVYAAHKYRNKLCELELAKRERHYDLLRRLAPAFVEAEASAKSLEIELGVVREMIQAERKKQQTKTPTGVSGYMKRAAEIKDLLKEARATLKSAKLAAYSDPKVKAAMAENAEQHKEECAKAKEDSGLYWGTELVVSQACRSFGSGSPPKFKRYTGQGQLAVQVQGGMDCSEALAPNTLVYIEGEGRRRTAKIRIGSTENRSPIFADMPIVMHRELPEGRIKWAFLQRRKRADKARYSLRFSVEVDDAPASEIPPGEVAIHVGWSMTPSGLKVATWLGSDGDWGVLVLPISHCDDYERLSEIQARRDNQFNEARERLQEWMEGRELPEWFTGATKLLHAWKQPLRLAILVNQWRDSRIDQDERIFSLLDQWRKRDKHAWQHFARLSERVTGRRKSWFGTFLSGLAKRYGVCVIAPVNVSELTENSDPEDVSADPKQMHKHARWAAPSLLLQLAKEKWPERCIEVDCANMSRQCMHCGHVNEPQGRRIQCHGCGRTWDIDFNGATVMLARGQAAKDSGALDALVEAREAKAVAAKEKLEKLAKARREKLAARKSEEKRGVKV